MRARCLVLVGLVVLAAGPASAQRLSVNPYSGLGFATSAPPDLCKMSTSGVDADARNTARHVAEAPGSPPQLELNNCHLHAVADSFAVSSPSTSPCHPDHEPPNGNCGRPLVEWCDNPCTTNACGQTGCLSAQCPVILTTHEVLAPSWSYTFPLNAASSHELVIDAAHQLKQLRGNCTCTTYSTPACPPPPPPPIDDDPPPDDGAPPLRPNPHCNDHEGMPCSPNTPGGSGGNDGGPPLDDDRDGYDETVDPDDRNPNVTPGSGDPDSVTGDVGNDYGDAPGSVCFSAEALVLLADGSRVPVRSLSLGDRLSSPEGPAVVIALYRDMRSKRWISFNGGEAFVTSSHPVSTSRGFVPAGEVVVGDVLHREDGLSLGVAEVSAAVRADLNINVETEDHRPFYVNAILFGSYPSYPPSGRN